MLLPHPGRRYHPADPEGSFHVADEHARTEYDALADLFLASDAARDPKPVTYPSRATQGGPALRLADQLDLPAASTPLVDEPATPEALTVEAMVLGHLPVLGAAWVTQYAKHVAEERRSAVALLRVHEGQAWIDVVMPRTAQARPQSRLGGGQDEPATLEAALQQASRECSHWLVRVDEIAELDLVALPFLTRVTLLTGADDAAVVASYRTIKNLSRSLDSTHAADAAPPSLKLAIMGADEAKASEAESKLRKAAAAFLQNELEPAAKVAKIGGSSTLALYRGHATMDVAAMLAVAHARSTPQPLAPSASQTTNQTTIQPNAEPAAPQQAHTPTSATADQPAIAAQPAATAAQQPAATQPATGVLPIAGLTPLPFVCPYAKHVTLAVGADNSLHLIAPAKPDPAQSLLEVAAWAHEHAPLLAMAHPGVRCDQTTLHALAEELADVRGLLHTAIIVHLTFRMGETVMAKRLN